MIPCRKHYRCKRYKWYNVFSNTPAKAESLLHSLERVERGIKLHVNTDKTVYMGFKRESHLQSAENLKLVDTFTAGVSQLLKVMLLYA